MRDLLAPFFNQKINITSPKYAHAELEMDLLDTFLAKNLSNVESIKKGNSRKFITKFQHWLRENTLSRSKKNIHAHYDLGNAFYELWLDSSMTYSSALFQNLEEEPLESAQKNKYQKIIDSLI